MQVGCGGLYESLSHSEHNNPREGEWRWRSTYGNKGRMGWVGGLYNRQGKSHPCCPPSPSPSLPLWGPWSSLDSIFRATLLISTSLNVFHLLLSVVRGAQWTSERHREGEKKIKIEEKSLRGSRNNIRSILPNGKCSVSVGRKLMFHFILMKLLLWCRLFSPLGALFRPIVLPLEQVQFTHKIPYSITSEHLLGPLFDPYRNDGIFFSPRTSNDKSRVVPSCPPFHRVSSWPGLIYITSEIRRHSQVNSVIMRLLRARTFLLTLR